MWQHLIILQGTNTDSEEVLRARRTYRRAVTQLRSTLVHETHRVTVPPPLRAAPTQSRVPSPRTPRARAYAHGGRWGWWRVLRVEGCCCGCCCDDGARHWLFARRCSGPTVERWLFLGIGKPRVTPDLPVRSPCRRYPYTIGARGSEHVWCRRFGQRDNGRR